MEVIAQGAESKIILDNDKIIKKRIKKNYRIKELDTKLRKHRTRIESRILRKANKLINTPELISVNDYSITMKYIKGEVLRDVIEKTNKKIIRRIGEMIAILHQNNIIHGDLTTSNIIISNNEPFIIDFGLSEIKESIEAKAVDLHVLKQAITSKHYRVANKVWNEIINGYKEYDKSSEVLNRLIIVESRGKYKH